MPVISPYTLHNWVQMDRLDEQYNGNGNGSGTLEESEQEELTRLPREAEGTRAAGGRA
ncbi:hypothetical protein AB0K40_11515 [Nonomuraea bangladeshensis]|uniref:Uncharacterized protein n=1 Tax=Nonomuraea bangladeshensis TaxID=404385 RepID=A0ABV3H1U7_9ACTN